MTFTQFKNRGFTTAELRNIDQANFTQSVTDIIALPVPNEFSDSTNINYSDVQDTDLLTSGVKSVLNKAPGSDVLLREAKKQSATTTASQQQLLFDSVGIKTHNFSWKLIPESQEEANNIVSIIKQFELAKLPSIDTLLAYPDVFKIAFGGVVPKLVTYLPCVITYLKADYANGYFQLYETGDFPEIILNITFSELSSRTRNIQNRLY